MRKILVCLLFLIVALPVFAQDELPPAEIENDEGGVEVITGEFAYTDPNLPTYGTQPLIFLGSMSALFTDEFTFSTEYLDLDAPQVLGTITSDVAQSPFVYEIRLPIDPGAAFHDVDNDGEDDSGVALFSVNFTFNGIGDPYIDDREFIYYRSYAFSLDFETLYQINGGTILVFAEEDGQGFPSGFGDDGALFTEDDPIVALPAGYTIVNMDSEPFTFDRSREGRIDVIESAGEELDDFSALSYPEAFEALIDLMRREYAFTEFKEVDWDALLEEYLPLMEAAQANNDSQAYQLALQQFSYEIPDGHIGIGSEFLNSIPLDAAFTGEVGIAVRELTDGRVIVNFVLEGSPAEEAGIEVGDALIAIDGTPIDEAISAAPELNPPYGSPTLRRLDQIRAVTLFEPGTEVELTVQKPDESEPTTVTLTAFESNASRIFSRGSVYGTNVGAELPIEYEILDSGYGYIAIYSFSDDNLLTLSLWQRAMATMNAFGVPGIIIDMRYNNGGSPDIYQPMLGYLFNEETFTGTSQFFFPDLEEFAPNELYNEVIVPADEGLRYQGEVVVLVSPACFSACEFFSYALTVGERAEIVGQYPTGGLGGGIENFVMPDGVFGQFTVGRAVNEAGEIHIEGSGVEPTIQVPVDETTLFTEGDPVLDAAVEYLDGLFATQIEEGGEIAIGDEVEGELAVNTRVQYTLAVEADAVLDLTLGDESGQFDTVLRVYDEDGNLLAENDDAESGGTFNSFIGALEVSGGSTLIIEVGTYQDSGEGPYTLTVEEAA